jgi:hypothetical protein
MDIRSVQLFDHPVQDDNILDCGEAFSFWVAGLLSIRARGRLAVHFLMLPRLP